LLVVIACFRSASPPNLFSLRARHHPTAGVVPRYNQDTPNELQCHAVVGSCGSSSNSIGPAAGQHFQRLDAQPSNPT
jgi:hypothetical protein